MASEFLRKIIFEIPDFYDELEFFFNSFDHIVAQRDGVIEMSSGSFPELDSARANISQWENKFDIYLKEQEARIK